MGKQTESPRNCAPLGKPSSSTVFNITVENGFSVWSVRFVRSTIGFRGTGDCRLVDNMVANNIDIIPDNNNCELKFPLEIVRADPLVEKELLRDFTGV